MSSERLEEQIRFLVEIDKAKGVLRQSLLTDGSRRENDAEHSWHLAIMALVLGEYANEPIDLLRVVKMLLVHDLVEIDAGDTFAYDDGAQADKVKKERAAAERIFGLLPPDLALEFRSLWEEFEERNTPDARYAAALDRLHPLLQNYYSQGLTWRRHGITKERATRLNGSIESGSIALWRFARALIEQADEKGYFARPGT